MLAELTVLSYQCLLRSNGHFITVTVKIVTIKLVLPDSLQDERFIRLVVDERL